MSTRRRLYDDKSKMITVNAKCSKCQREQKVTAAQVIYYIDMRKEGIPCEGDAEGYHCHGRVMPIEDISQIVGKSPEETRT